MTLAQRGGALSEDQAARWHIDAQGTDGRRDGASLQQAQWRLEKALVAKGVVVDGSEARFSLVLPLSLAAWAGCALRYVPIALVYNYLRRESRHVEIMAPREEVLTSGATTDLELFTFREPDPRVDDASEVVMIFDALGHSTDAQLNRFVVDMLPVGRARRVRLVWLDRSEPFAQKHLLPTLRDLVRSMSRLRTEGVTTFHLGFCTPDFLAFLAGAQLNRFFPIKVYEWDKVEGWYRYVADLPTALERGPRAPSTPESALQK